MTKKQRREETSAQFKVEWDVSRPNLGFKCNIFAVNTSPYKIFIM